MEIQCFLLAPSLCSLSMEMLVMTPLHDHGYAVWQQCLCFASAFPLCSNVDIDQLKLIMLLVGTPGPELLTKMSSESVSGMFWRLPILYVFAT